MKRVGVEKKLRDNGPGYESNNAKAKGGLNKALLNVGIGQLKVMLKEKVEVRGNKFELVSALYNSQACNRCGVVDKKSRVSQSEFKCVACGHSENADTNAAKNVVAKSELAQRFKVGACGLVSAKQSSKRSYPAFSGKVKPVKDSGLRPKESMQQESAQAKIPGLTGKSLPFKGNNRKQIDRSAQTYDENHAQLDLWNAVAEIQIESS